MRAPLSPAVLVATALLLTGCAALVPDPTGPAAQQPPAPAVEYLTGDTVLRIPKLGIDQPVPLALGLTDVGEVEVPPLEQPEVLGEWVGGVTPGDDGVSVLFGHISGRRSPTEPSIPGVFARLDDLAVGDLIEVQRPDGQTVKFAVAATEGHLKSQFPSARVYQPTPEPTLILVSCTGTLRDGHYNQNRVVWATAV
jgi:sortase (surface protein transpeptidase)